MDIKYYLDVTAYNDEDDDAPTSADVTLTMELIERIIFLSKTLFDIEAHKICLFNDTPQWLEESYDPADDPCGETSPELREDKIPFTGKLNTVELTVFKERFRWSGYLNNSSVTFLTDSIPMSEIIEVKEIWDVPIEDLSIWIENIKSEKAKGVFEWRLKNE